MNAFLIEVVVYGLKFEKPVLGSISDYTDEEILEIKKEYKKEIAAKIANLGFVGFKIGA